MSYGLAISPDVHVRDLSDWYLFNTRLQRLTGQAFRAALHDDAETMRRACARGDVDLVYANAADTVTLVRRGYRVLARPAGVSDEAAVVVAADSSLSAVEGIQGGLVAATTDAPDVQRICCILLEPADLDPGQIRLSIRRNYTLVAKALLAGEADAGFFLLAAFDDLSPSIRSALRPLITSSISVMSHALLASPAIQHLAEPILAALAQLSADPASAGLLVGLGAPRGWAAVSEDEVAFVMDVLSALA